MLPNPQEAADLVTNEYNMYIINILHYYDIIICLYYFS